eukprot:TRINITY_DN24093_c0_g1_i1.p1 TRINITY_DN24093_c0_g1~~TRINITY_DN24093_c0_g1_i1.p1  ORF type:complete len:178 (-),score=21.14 TRINITY_DN24093_c0_g1_i1:896-1429(-)
MGQCKPRGVTGWSECCETRHYTDSELTTVWVVSSPVTGEWCRSGDKTSAMKVSEYSIQSPVTVAMNDYDDTDTLQWVDSDGWITNSSTTEYSHAPRGQKRKKGRARPSGVPPLRIPAAPLFGRQGPCYTAATTPIGERKANASGPGSMPGSGRQHQDGGKKFTSTHGPYTKVAYGGA